MGLIASKHVESSWTRDRTSVPCIGRRFLSTEPPGKSPIYIFIYFSNFWLFWCLALWILAHIPIFITTITTGILKKFYKPKEIFMLFICNHTLPYPQSLKITIFHCYSFIFCRDGNGNPLQCSCLENPRDGGSLVGCHLWGHTESDTTEAT